MGAIPSKEASTVQRIYALYEAREAAQPWRGHLGASVIGRPCERALWYGFRWAAPKDWGGRLLRLFDTGKREEARLIEELRGIGATVWETDPETGKQIAWSDVEGHFAGSCDGIAEGLPEAPKTPHILEFKTHNAKSFAELKTKGVATAKPEHYAQMICYMGWSELTRALYIAVCKDTDEIYAERIEFDPTTFYQLQARATRIIRASEPPARISEDPAWWLCKLCDYHAICHGESAPAANCRTCTHATPIAGAAWKCERFNMEIPPDNQRQGCDDHRFIPPLLTFAVPLDASDDAVIYEMRDGSGRFANGERGTEIKDEKGEFLPVYPSHEMAGKPAALLTDPFVRDVRAKLDGTLEFAEDEIPF